MERYASTVVGFVRDEETPEAIINGTSPAGLAQVEGWVLRAVRTYVTKNRGSATFAKIEGASGIQRELVGPLLARLVDSGALVWADDGGYLPVGGAT